LLAHARATRLNHVTATVENEQLVGGLEHDFYFSIYWEQ
jgi:hypothetical protein